MTREPEPLAWELLRDVARRTYRTGVPDRELDAIWRNITRTRAVRAQVTRRRHLALRIGFAAALLLGVAVLRVADKARAVRGASFDLWTSRRNSVDSTLAAAVDVSLRRYDRAIASAAILANTGDQIVIEYRDELIARRNAFLDRANQLPSQSR